MQNFSLLWKPLLDSSIIQMLDDLGIKTNIETGPWIAGGTARRLWFGESWINADIDLFFQDESSLHLILSNLYLYNNTHAISSPHITSNAVSFKLRYKDQELKIQCITKQYHKDFYSVWRSFDFTVCCFAATDDILLATESAIEDCTAKVLRPIPDSTRRVDARRVSKYGIYGFKPVKSILQELCQQYAEKTITETWDDDDEYT